MDVHKRIDGTLLQANQGKVVRVIGALTGMSGSEITLSSNGDVKVSTSALESEDFQNGKNYEIVGKVNDELEIQAYALIPISDDFKYENYYKLVKFIDKVPELFE